jgi:hypothetical protein
METMHAAGRRNLPPVPRPAGDTAPADGAPLAGQPAEDSPAGSTIELRPGAAERTPADVADVAVDPEQLAAADEPEYALDDDDPAQDFVSRLRSAADDFAAAAGAETAVVREAVPPARHRRSRCRVVLRYPDGSEADLTFLGAVGRPGTPAWEGFDQQIQRWLGAGQQRQDAWVVEDTDAPDGTAVDVPAWLASA